MTTAADAFAARDRSVIRWGGSLVVALALHSVLALLVMSRQFAVEPDSAPPAAVMIDLAPLPVPAPPEPAPPEPVVEPQVQPPPHLEPPPLPEPQVQPEPPLPLPEITLPPELSPAPKPAVTLPVKPPAQPKPPKVSNETPPNSGPAIMAPPPPAMSAPATRSAPSRVPAANPGPIRTNWQAQLVSQLERYKRYPRIAQEQRQQGTAHLRFTVDRQGRVLSFQLERSSGVALLDEEVLALIQRAQPLPAPPPEVPGDRIQLVVPIQFLIQGGAR